MHGPEPIEPRHETEEFDSGEPEIDDWLRDHALQAHRGGFARTFVIHEDGRVFGFYTLASGAIRPEEAPERVIRGGSRQDVPVVILARLATDVSVRARGYGDGLVRDALLRIAAAGDMVGIRAVLVHLKRPELESYYRRFDFEVGPFDRTKMFLLMKDLRRDLGL